MRSPRYPACFRSVAKSGDRTDAGPLSAQYRQRRDALYVVGVALIATVGAVLSAPAAKAEDSVTYEIVSDQNYVPAANVEYYERSERKALQQVSLPWRLTVDVPQAVSPTKDGAQIRADWRPYRWAYKYVTVRIYLGAHLLCESTLDVGDATCYGSTPHRNFPQTGGGW